MFKKVVFLALMSLVLSSCVSKKVYQELEGKYQSLQASNLELLKEKDELIASKTTLLADLEKIKAQLSEVEKQKLVTENQLTALQSKLKKLEESYDSLSNQSSKQLAEQAKKNQDLLKQLETKELKLAAESSRLEKLQKELKLRSEQIDELQALIDAKEAQMQQLKDAVSKALHNFEGKGLTVVHKNGKIYVSMENKLLFNSGSWAVGTEGKKAVEQLATVLAENKDINVLIEGHTDDVPYTGSTLIDNWDLSVKRATAIVRILQGKGVDPTQITAAGRSEFMPVDSNKSSDGKAKNRRIEIILAPNLDEISKLLKD